MADLLPLFLSITVVVLIGMVVVCLVQRRRSRLAIRDLTRHVQQLEKACQEALTREEAHSRDSAWHRILFHNSRDMVLVYEVSDDDMPLKIVAVNEMACQKLERSREQLIGMSPLNIETPRTDAGAHRQPPGERGTMSAQESVKHKTMLLRRLMRRILTSPHVSYEREFLTRTEARIPVEVTAHAFEFEGRRLVMQVAQDITERKAAEQALRISQRRFREFFAHSPIGVALYSPNRELLDANLACLRMLGVPDREEFARMNFFDNQWLTGRQRDVLNHGESIRYEAFVDFDAIRSDARFVSARRGNANLDVWVNNLGLDDDFQPKGYLVEIQDISRRRQAEKALKERERQLRQSQKLQAIGTLSGGIAHDFNNILTPILGYAELVSHSLPENDPVRDYVTEVLKASRRAKELVKQILTFSRQSEEATRVVRIIPIVKEVLQLLKSSSPHPPQIELIDTAEHDAVLADPTQLHQVVMNLCAIALYAMRDNGGRLVVTVDNIVVEASSVRDDEELAPGRYMRIVFKDTGCGMSGETVERIFEPFFTTKPKGEGTGMGLAVVHGILSGLEGAMTVRTEEGQGSTFVVMLPMATATEKAAPQEDRALPAGNERVLLVDDEQEVVRMGAQMLAGLGYRPVVANSADEALKLIASAPEAFDVVISDQVMPGISGLELAARLQKIRPGLPVVLCTGFSSAVTQQAMEKGGVCEILMKPMGMRDLAEALRRALDSGEPPPEVKRSGRGKVTHG